MQKSRERPLSSYNQRINNPKYHQNSVNKSLLILKSTFRFRCGDGYSDSFHTYKKVGKKTLFKIRKIPTGKRVS